MNDPHGTAIWRPAIVTATLTFVLGILLSGGMVVIIAGPQSILPTMRAAVTVWLVSVGGSLRLEGDVIGVMPIGASVLIGVLTYVIARRTLRKRQVDPRIFTPTAGGLAAVISGVAAPLVATDDIATSMVRAAVGAFVIVSIGAGLAATRQAKQRWFNLPQRWWPVAEGASTSLLVLFGSATFVTLIALVRSLDEAADMWASVGPGAEGPWLGVLMILAFPTAVLWTSSLLLGPGFMVGDGTRIDLAGTTVEHLPAVPLLSGIPDPGLHSAWVLVLALVPILGGVIGGVVLRHRTLGPVDWQRCLGDAVIGGVVAGLAAGVLLATSAGGIGPGALTFAGPSWWLPGLVAVLVLTLGTALGAAAAHYRGLRGDS